MSKSEESGAERLPSDGAETGSEASESVAEVSTAKISVADAWATGMTQMAQLPNAKSSVRQVLSRFFIA